MIPVRGWAGSWDASDDWECIALLPSTLREILEPLGFQPEEIVERWAERHWIALTDRRAHGKVTRNRASTVRIHGAPMRVYQITRDAVDSQVAVDELDRADYAGMAAAEAEDG